MVNMKQIRFLVIIGSLLAFPGASCKNPVFFSEYSVLLPALPRLWREILGEPHWRLEWVGKDGAWHSQTGSAAALSALELPEDRTVPLLAYPFWPGRPLAPGIMRPAGALFPFDVEGKALRASWEAGVDAVFYREMAAASVLLGSGQVGRQGVFFDWPRFRALFHSAESPIPGELRRDPWLVDWASLALKTVESGFDRRRVRRRELEEFSLELPGPGPWAGTSPFEAFPPWEQGERAVLDASGEVRALVSSGGMLRYTRGAWLWMPWD
ncbi:MAG: hypothetical protein LBD37_01665 [Treponema sp.]|nr:hypothetical protein [Treponema sp.]